MFQTGELTPWCVLAAMDQKKNQGAPGPAAGFNKTHRRNQSTVSCKSFAGQSMYLKYSTQPGTYSHPALALTYT